MSTARSSARNNPGRPNFPFNLSDISQQMQHAAGELTASGDRCDAGVLMRTSLGGERGEGKKTQFKKFNKPVCPFPSVFSKR